MDMTSVKCADLVDAMGRMYRMHRHAGTPRPGQPDAGADPLRL